MPSIKQLVPTDNNFVQTCNKPSKYKWRRNEQERRGYKRHPVRNPRQAFQSISQRMPSHFIERLGCSESNQAY